MEDVIHIVKDQDGERAWFVCPGCGEHHAPYVSGSKAWQWNNSTTKPTFKPSILVRWGNEEGYQICHSFVTDGEIRFLNDCTHENAGKTLPLKPSDPIG